MIGLLWLKLLNKNIEEITPKTLSLDEVYPRIQEFKKSLSNVNNFQLIEMLLDLNSLPNLQLENVILEFDQWIIIVIKKQEELVSGGLHDGNHLQLANDNGAFGEMSRDTQEKYKYGERDSRDEQTGGQQHEIIKMNLTNNLTTSKPGKLSA